MGEHLEVVVGYVGHGQDLKLSLDSSAGDVDGEKDGECNDTSNQTGDDGDLEEAQEEVAIHGVVLEHVGIRDVVERFDPVEESSGKIRSSLAGTQCSKHSSWAVVAREPLAEEAEEQEECDGVEENGDERGHDRRGRLSFFGFHIFLLRAIAILCEYQCQC